MKFKSYDTSKEIDTDKEKDYVAMQYEKMDEIVKWFKSNNIYMSLFTLDCEGRASNCVHLPNHEDQENISKFLLNIDETIRGWTENKIGLANNE